MVTAEQELNRLRWRCRRGMRELDALLIDFVDRHYGAACDDEQKGFRALLSLSDPEILSLLTDRVRSDDPAIDRVVGRILDERISPGD